MSLRLVSNVVQVGGKEDVIIELYSKSLKSKYLD